MTEPFNKKHFEDELTFEQLKTWCQTNVSTDIIYTGNTFEQKIEYLELAKHYLDQFLMNVPELSTQPSLAFNGMTAIQYAAQQGYDRYIDNLSDVRPEIINQSTATGMKPLHLAVSGDHINTIIALLKQGADATCTDQLHQLPIFGALLLPMLHDETLIHKKELIFHILQAATPGHMAHQDSNGDTVFHLMAEYGFKKILAEGIKQSAHVLFISNNQTKYPIHSAILNAQFEIVDLLLRDPEEALLTDINGCNALHYAAQYGAKNLVQRCCEAATDINIRNKKNQSALAIAMQAKNQGAIEVLIKFGASQNV
jgi:ankyrin repeat protein